MSEWRTQNTGMQRYPRIAAETPVRISTVEPERDLTTGKLFFRSSEETTANLSGGGAFVRSWEPLEMGRKVVVDIDLPGGSHLQLVARVVWTQRQFRAGASTDFEGPGYGLEFDTRSDTDQARLDRFLETLPSAPQTRVGDTTQPPPAQPS